MGVAIVQGGEQRHHCPFVADIAQGLSSPTAYSPRLIFQGLKHRVIGFFIGNPLQLNNRCDAYQFIFMLKSLI